MDVTKYGPWAVIAGGSEGVGRAFATQLAEAGLNLVLIARKPVALEETAALCHTYGVAVRPLALDLTAPDSVARVIDEVEDVEVGLLVYNAGATTHSEALLDGDLVELQRVVDLHVTTPLTLIHHFGGSMRDRGRGGILLVGSRAEDAGSVRHALHGGVRAFGRVFAEGLWGELRDRGVDVLELVLGATAARDDPEDVAREGLARLAHGPDGAARGRGSSGRRGPV